MGLGERGPQLLTYAAISASDDGELAAEVAPHEDLLRRRAAVELLLDLGAPPRGRRRRGVLVFHGESEARVRVRGFSVYVAEKKTFEGWRNEERNNP